jgi:uncharacterized membrane protein YkgB
MDVRRVAVLGILEQATGILGAIGSTLTFLGTVTIIPFMPDGWDPVAGGFPAMTGNVPFLMKDVVLLAASFYLLKQDVARSMASAEGSGRADCAPQWCSYSRSSDIRNGTNMRRS